MYTLVLLIALVAVVLGAVVAVRGGSTARRRLRWAVLALTVLIAALLTPYTVADSGAASIYLLGVPIVAAAVPVIADLAGVARTAADACGGILMTAWAVLLALGIGAAFLPGGLVLMILALSGLAPATRRGHNTL